MSESQPGQLLLVGLPEPELDSGMAALLRRIQPGGYILMGRNITSPSQLRNLIDALRDLSDVEPIITIDQEGGRVSRLRLIGSEPPSAQQLRDNGDASLVKKHGAITGRLLRLFGFNLDLCPVLDISFDDAADNSLGGRCYGRTVEEVVNLAGTFNRALRNEGIRSCGKHFPGYSSASVDAHHDLPRINRSRDELEREELSVFRQFSKLVDSMMTCHAWFPCFNSDKLPASLSEAVVETLLRRSLGFDGLVMTDDLDMGAIYHEYSLCDTLRMAITAGNDMALMCHRFDAYEEAYRVVSDLPRPLLDRALMNIGRFKEQLSSPHKFSEEAFAKVDTDVWELRLEVLGPEQAAKLSVEDGKRSPTEKLG